MRPQHSRWRAIDHEEAGYVQSRLRRGVSSDRLDPAVALVERAKLDVIVFECVGERTLAFGHRDRMRDPSTGYNTLLSRRLRAILPACVANKTRIVTQHGCRQSARGSRGGRFGSRANSGSRG